MRRSGVVCASLTAGLVLAPGAVAQTETEPQVIAERIPMYHELILSRPAPALSTFKAATSHSATFDARVTTTEGAVELSVIDADATGGAKVGRFARGARTLSLEFRARGSAFAPLGAAGIPLRRVAGPVSQGVTHVDVRQRVERKTPGTYRKLVLVTLSTSTP